ncbi:MAG: hypothetical protein ACOC1F_04120 [Myxococcota bacterium]
MMHELLALPNDGTTLTPDDVDLCLREESRIYRDGDERWTYGNSQTSVGFTLVWSRFPTPRLACRVPCPRPAFFGTEARELMRRVAERLPVRLEGTEGFDQDNARAVRSLRDKAVRVPAWPAAQAERWWTYMRAHDSLVQRFDTEGIFAPRVFLFSDKRAERVRTAIAWCDAQAMIFPSCDLVLVLDRSQEPTASGRDTRLRGVMAAPQVMEALGQRLEKVPSPAGELDVLRPKATAGARKVFLDLAVEPPPSPAELEGISADRPIAETAPGS